MANNFDNLHKFIANNYDLENLEAILNEFNPFKILKVDHYEIRHSNIISWLLNPKENHNLGDSFVKKFLSEVIINNENLETDLNAFKVQDISFYDFEIRREWRNIDILLISHFNKLAIIIENKIYSSESKGQLNKYYETIKSEYSEYDLVPVLLTIEGYEPTDNRYGKISYIQIFSMLKFITSIQKDNLNHKIFDFIEFYLRILEVLKMENEEIKALCKKIYKEHKQALDLIYEYADETEFEESATEFINSLQATNIGVDGRSAWFIPKNIESCLKKVAEESWAKGYPLAFWYIAQDEKLGIIIEVGPFQDAQFYNTCSFI